jgi:hypothetical protein
MRYYVMTGLLIAGTVAGVGCSGQAPLGLGYSGGGAAGGSGTVTSAPGPTAVQSTGLPCDVESLVEAACQGCHLNPPAHGAVMPLVTYADFVAPAVSDPTKKVYELIVGRMSSTTKPMPPAPYAPATPAMISIMQNWINAGVPQSSAVCTGSTPPSGGGGAGGSTGGGGSGGGHGVSGGGGGGAAGGGGGTGGGSGGGSGGAGGGGSGGFGGGGGTTTSVCTSGTYFTGGEGGDMNPGNACIQCHAQSGGEAPTFTIAGTAYPTLHEPNNCDGENGGGAQVIITDANSNQITIPVDSVGNFYYGGAVAAPFNAKIVNGSNELDMVSHPAMGDCNTCHTQTGANGAPGRITLP